MIKRVFLILFTIAFAFSTIFPQGKQKKAVKEEPVVIDTTIKAVAKIGKEVMTLSEFEESFAKNNGGWEKATQSTQEEREKYLELLVKFKTKVYEARERGLLKDKEIQDELETYSASVASTYFIEKELIAPGIKRMYDRKEFELCASHILFPIRGKGTPAETLTAYKKAIEAIELVDRMPFDSLALLVSEDPTVTQNKGDLGYFTSGRMVPAFEDAAYEMQVGEVHRVPVRTQFGYHIIKLTDKIKNLGAAHIHHILIRFGMVAGDTAAAQDSTHLAYWNLTRGMSFEDAARRFSQDPGSGPRGGDVGIYDRSQIPSDLATYIFNLPVGIISEPYRAPYGFHIFKVSKRMGVQSFEEMQNSLRQGYQQYRQEYDYQNLLTYIKTKYNLVMNEDVIAELIQSLDTTKTTTHEKWSDTLSTAVRKKTLFTVDGKQITVQMFVKNTQETKGYETVLLIEINVRNLVNKFAEQKTLEVHSLNVVSKYPEYIKLMEEYRDGILLYRVEQDEVWKKIKVNDKLLKQHYNKTKDNYRWPDRVNFAEIYLATDSAVAAIQALLKEGKKFSDLAAQYTERPGYKEKKGEWGLIAVTTNELSTAAYAMLVNKVSDPIQYQGWRSIIKTLKKDPARIKTFDEAKPEVASAYQDFASKEREKQWVDSLKKKYKVMVFNNQLANAFQK